MSKRFRGHEIERPICRRKSSGQAIVDVALQSKTRTIFSR